MNDRFIMDASLRGAADERLIQALGCGAKGDEMGDLLLAVLLIGGYVALLRFVLPKMGVHT